MSAGRHEGRHLRRGTTRDRAEGAVAYGGAANGLPDRRARPGMRLLHHLGHALLAIPMLLLLALAALVARAQTAACRRSGKRPRLVWGPTPIIAIRYWSLA